MTDRERAARLIHAVAGSQSGADALAAVVQQFAAVRLHERTAIVGYLRERAQDRALAAVGCAVLHAVADRIERGEQVS